MKLIYFWIEKYKCLEACGLSLNAERKITSEYSIETKTLKIELQKRTQTEVFNKDLNITAIVGSNGSGKSSIIEALYLVLNKKIKESNYCLIYEKNAKYYFLKSEDLKIEPLGFDICQANEQNISKLFCTPFKKENYLSDRASVYYNNYDTEFEYQDKINTYLYYDRFSNREVARVIGYTQKFLKKCKFIEENPQLLFDSFYWWIDIYSCYEYIVYRLKNVYDFNYKKEDEKLKNYNFGIFVFLPTGPVKEFLSIIDKIAPFTRHKTKISNSREYLLKDILPDILFYAAIFEFATFLDSIYNEQKKLAFQKYETEALKYVDIDWKPIDEIFEYIFTKYKDSPNPKLTLLKIILRVLKNKRMSYNKCINRDDKSFNFVENFEKYIDNILNPHKYENIFNNFLVKEKKSDIFALRDEYILDNQLFGFAQKDSRNLLDLKPTYITEYAGIDNEAIDALCETFASRFLIQFFSIDFCKKEKDSELHSATYSFQNLSTGEQRMLKFMGDLAYCRTKDVYIFDEMDLSWHPDWQKDMIFYITDLLEKRNGKNSQINIIMTTHSPLILSDLPRSNVVLIEKDKKTQKTIFSKNEVQTFSANIHSLFANNFFLKTNIGRIAQNKINYIATKIRNQNIHIEELDKELDIIGEPVIKNQLLKLYEYSKQKNKDYVSRLEEENASLKRKIKEMELENEKNNNC